MQRPARTILATIALVLSACDPIYGVQTSLTLPGPIDMDCIGRAVIAASTGGKVEFQQQHYDSFEIAPHWGKLTETITFWLYGPAEDRGVLQIHQGKGPSTIANGLMRLGVRISKERLRAYMPLMHRVNSVVESTCGVKLNSKGSTRRY